MREPSSTPVVGWTKEYGKSQVVTLQSGHYGHTFAHPHFRKLLQQSLQWVWERRSDHKKQLFQ